MIEINPATLQRSGYTALEVIEAIGRHGYRMYYAGRFGFKLLQRLPVYGEEPNIYAFPILLTVRSRTLSRLTWTAAGQIPGSVSRDHRGTTE
jgi:hypothetical protein